MSQSKARAKRPGKQTSVTKNNFIEIRPILFALSTYSLKITSLVFELGRTESRQIKVAQLHQQGY